MVRDDRLRGLLTMRLQILGLILEERSVSKDEAYHPTSFTHSSSLRILTPRASAFFSLEPASVPATT